MRVLLQEDVWKQTDAFKDKDYLQVDPSWSLFHITDKPKLYLNDISVRRDPRNIRKDSFVIQKGVHEMSLWRSGSGQIMTWILGINMDHR